MRKSLKVSEPAQIAERRDMELLVSHKPAARPSRSGVSSRVKLHIFLLVLGLFGSGVCLWAMLYTSDSEEVALNLGLNRVANSLENILELLAYPVLMFTVILSTYAGQQLIRIYRAANDPESYRKLRKR